MAYERRRAGNMSNAEPSAQRMERRSANRTTTTTGERHRGRRSRHRRRRHSSRRAQQDEVVLDENLFNDDAYDTSNAVVVCTSCQTSSATESLLCVQCGAVLLERLLQQSAFVAGEANGDENSEENECTVCLEEKAAGERLVALPCLHTFHARCIAEWFAKAKVDSCPLCKNKIG